MHKTRQENISTGEGLHIFREAAFQKSRRLASDLDKTLLSPSPGETATHGDLMFCRSVNRVCGTSPSPHHSLTVCINTVPRTLLFVFPTTLDVRTILATCLSHFSSQSIETSAPPALHQDAYRRGEHSVPVPDLDARRQPHGESQRQVYLSTF